MTAFKIETILCAIDFSEHSAEVLRFATGLAACSGNKTRIVALYADLFEPPVYFTATQDGDLRGHLEKSRNFMMRKLKAFVEPYTINGQAIESLVSEHAPAQGILEAARDYSADLTVMGTHGRTGLSRFMMGSVAERVLAEIESPVLTIRAGKDEGAPPAKVEKILCPVNFSLSAEFALQAASTLALCLKAELNVLHVVENMKGSNGQPEAFDKLCKWVPEMVHPACDFKTIVRSGDAADQILDIAGKSGSCMIVLGAQRKFFADTSVLGSTVVSVTRHAPCPVLTLPLHPNMK